MILQFFIHVLNVVLFKCMVWVVAYMAKYMGFHDVESNAIRDKEMGHCRVKAAMTLFVAPSSG
jgi:hypothetical protein